MATFDFITNITSVGIPTHSSVAVGYANNGQPYIFTANENGGVSAFQFNGSTYTLIEELNTGNTVRSVDFRYESAWSIYPYENYVFTADYSNGISAYGFDPTQLLGSRLVLQGTLVGINVSSVWKTKQAATTLFVCHGSDITNSVSLYVYSPSSQAFSIHPTFLSAPAVLGQEITNGIGVTVSSYDPLRTGFVMAGGNPGVILVNITTPPLSIDDTDATLGYCYRVANHGGWDSGQFLALCANGVGLYTIQNNQLVLQDSVTTSENIWFGGFSPTQAEITSGSELVPISSGGTTAGPFGYEVFENSLIEPPIFSTDGPIANSPYGSGGFIDGYYHIASTDGVDAVLNAYEYILEGGSSSDEEPSSSSSSQTESSSSSSSEGGLVTRELYSTIIQQEHHDLIPFSFIAESGIEYTSTIGFEFETISGNNFDYSILVGNSTSTPTTYIPSAYVPEDEAASFEHKNAFHIEILAKDASGIKDYNVRTQEEIYGYEKPEYTFNVPKFSWSNEIFGANVASETSEDLNEGSVWIGNAAKDLHRVRYDSDYAEITFSSQVASEPHTILFEKNSSRTYITAYEHLINNAIDDYWSEGSITSEIFENKSIANDFNDVAVLSETNTVWTVQSYSGKVLSRNPGTLVVLNEYGGFDAPHNVIWSQYHQSYYVAGTNILWSLSGGVKKAVYEIKGYDIADFDISPEGYVCLILDGDADDIIRILKPDLYSIALSETITVGTARYCKHCDQGIFYILVELSNETSYGFVSYLYNTRSGVLKTVADQSELSTTTTTTTPTAPTNKVEVDYPNGAEWLQIEEEVEILWRSSESATDNVKIELYKGGVFNSTITGTTVNTGVYKWTIPDTITNGINYTIKITWLGATELPENIGTSDSSFTITNVVTTTTTTTTQSLYKSIGIDFNVRNRHVVNVLTNGLIGFYDLDDDMFYGLFDSTTTDVNCMAVRDSAVSQYSNVSATRVFVGSELYMSDKWDSGIINTDQTAMYYGGGNNLTPGRTYFVNIQVYDVQYGWSGVQTKEWTMPR